MKDSRSLDKLANELTSNHVLHNDTFHPRSVHMIIQSCRASRARHGRKPAADLGARIDQKLPHEHVRALRAATEATLPGDFGLVARGMCLESAMKQLLKRARSTTVAALGAAADHDLEATPRQASIIAT
jgi:hypothetical protein